MPEMIHRNKKSICNPYIELTIIAKHIRNVQRPKHTPMTVVHVALRVDDAVDFVPVAVTVGSFVFDSVVYFAVVAVRLEIRYFCKYTFTYQKQ